MPGATDNSTVKITITVVDANSGQVISQTTKNLTGLGNAGKEAGDKIAGGAMKGVDALGQLEVEGAQAAKAVAGGAAQAEQAAQSMGSTWLTVGGSVAQQFGIQIPGALSTAATAVGVLSTATIALGAAGAAVWLLFGNNIKSVIQDLRDADDEVKKFDRDASRVSGLRFFDQAQFAQTRQQFAAIDKDLTDLDAKHNARMGLAERMGYFLSGSPGAAVLGLGRGNLEKDEVERRNRERGIANTEPLKQEQDRHEAAMAHIDAEGKAAGAMRDGQAKAQAEYAIAVRRADEDHLNRVNKQNAEIRQNNGNAKPGDKNYLPLIDPNAPDPQRDAAVQRAGADRSARNVEFARQESDEVRRLREEADKAGLSTYQKFEADRRAAREEFVQKYGADAAGLAQIDRRFHEERMRYLRDENEETNRLHAQALEAGTTGLARIDAQTRAREAELERQSKNFGNPATYARRKGDIDAAGQAEQAKAIEGFNDRIAQMDETRVNRTMSANQRIDAETRRAQQSIMRAWQDLYGGLDALDQRRVTSYAALQGELAKIAAAGVAQKAEVRQGLEDQTLKAEDAAARAGMTREQEQRAAVVDQYNERYRQLEELRVKDADNADLYRRQEVAAEQEKNGKLIEMQRRTRDQLAGTLRGFMSNPLEAIKRQGEEAASRYAADMILKHTGGINPFDPENNGKRGGGGLFGLPNFGGRGRGPFSAGTNSGTVDHAAVHAGSSTLSAGTATIYVQQATIAGGVAVSAGGAATSGLPGGGASLSGLPGVPEYGAGGPSFSNQFAGGSAGFASGAGGSTLDTVVGGAQSGLGMTQSAADLGKQIFGANGPAANPGISKAIGGAGSFIGKAAPVVGAAAGVYSAVESNGGFGGALGGAMSGMQLGAMVGGPLGAAIGAGTGAIVGFIGFGGRAKAHKYWTEQVKPHIDADTLQFGMGDMPYQDAYDDLSKLNLEARNQTKQWGMGGKSEYSGTIEPAIKNAQQQLTREQKAGRSRYGVAAAQFDGGGVVRGFGDLATGPRNGWINAELGETVVHTSATAMHGDALSLMLAGANRQQVANYYTDTMQPAGGGGDVNLHFHSHDARGAYQLFMDHKHTIREALNSSYAENSGGADA